jgi:hypothetical protein
MVDLIGRRSEVRSAAFRSTLPRTATTNTLLQVNEFTAKDADYTDELQAREQDKLIQ